MISNLSVNTRMESPIKRFLGFVIIKISFFLNSFRLSSSKTEKISSFLGILDAGKSNVLSVDT